MLEAPFFEADLRPQQRGPGGSSAGKGSRRRAPGAQAPLPSVDETPVATIMSADVVSFAADTSIETATRVMLERGISGAPVVDADGRPIGMVSKSDLLEAWHEHGKAAREDEDPRTLLQRGGHACDLGPGFHVETRTHIAVNDIMVPYLLAVSRRAPISLAAALMAYEGVHRLLVLNEVNEMVGIVSALDVLRWLAQLSGFCLPRYTQRQRA